MTAVHGLGLGKSNEWYTPRFIFDALQENFDLDVAAPIGGPRHVPAKRWLSELDNGLLAPWEGFVWMNPPFGGRNALRPWLDRFFDHGDGIALTPDRASAPWWHEAAERADAVMFMKGKPRFEMPDGSKGGCPAFGACLWASGSRAVTALRRAQSLGFLASKLV